MDSIHQQSITIFNEVISVMLEKHAAASICVCFNYKTRHSDNNLPTRNFKCFNVRGNRAALTEE